MKSRELEFQLRTYLPLYNEYFMTWLDVSSYIVSSSVATITTAAVHGLSTGDILNVKDVVFPNIITSLTQASGVGTAVLQSDTDLTYPNTKTITISGATESEYNDTFNIIDIPDRQTITFQISTSAAASATGSPISHEENLIFYNGLFEIQTVPTISTFTLSVRNVDFTALAGTQYYNIKNTRIVSEISEERMEDVYTKQSLGNWFLFVIAGDGIVSRNKDITTDFNYTYPSGANYVQNTQESFSVYVIVPTQNKITPVDAQDLCRNKVKKDIILTLCGYFPTQLYNAPYQGVFYESDSIAAYNTSYYIHQYTFSTTVNIEAEDIFVPTSIAIKTIDFNVIDVLNDIKSTDSINFETL